MRVHRKRRKTNAHDQHHCGGCGKSKSDNRQLFELRCSSRCHWCRGLVSYHGGFIRDFSEESGEEKLLPTLPTGNTCYRSTNQKRTEIFFLSGGTGKKSASYETIQDDSSSGKAGSIYWRENVALVAELGAVN